MIFLDRMRNSMRKRKIFIFFKFCFEHSISNPDPSNQEIMLLPKKFLMSMGKPTNV